MNKFKLFFYNQNNFFSKKLLIMCAVLLAAHVYTVLYILPTTFYKSSDPRVLLIITGILGTIILGLIVYGSIVSKKNIFLVNFKLILINSTRVITITYIVAIAFIPLEYILWNHLNYNLAKTSHISTFQKIIVYCYFITLLINQIVCNKNLIFDDRSLEDLKK